MSAGGLAAAWRRLASGRKPHGIAALLLPYTHEGRVDWSGFERLVARAHGAGLEVAVNMDTGFGDLLASTEREAVLDATRRALGPGVPFSAGAFAEPGESLAAAWRRAVAAIAARGGRPVIV
jgi:dihydrodipicolinate synthase/N-acetylneuraminate lyase